MSDSEPLEFECAQGREIGNEAFWSLSSAKPGNGIDQLRDGIFVHQIYIIL